VQPPEPAELRGPAKFLNDLVVVPKLLFPGKVALAQLREVLEVYDFLNV